MRFSNLSLIIINSDDDNYDFLTYAIYIYLLLYNLQEGMTPLHLAAKQGHLRVLNALKGSVDLKVCSRKTGFTALHVAAANGQIDFVSEMLTQTPAGILSERPLADPSADVSRWAIVGHNLTN